MGVTAIRLLEQARRKFFINSTYITVQKVGIKRFWDQEAEGSLTAINLLESARRKFFMNSTYIMSIKWESNVFGLRIGRNETHTQQLAGIGERKIFHELDVDHFKKVGIKSFWAQEAEMKFTANSSPESARRKFSMNSTYIIPRKQESNLFGFRRPKRV